MVGLGGLEPPTSHLSGAHSNQLSYKPIFYNQKTQSIKKLNYFSYVKFFNLTNSL